MRRLIGSMVFACALAFGLTFAPGIAQPAQAQFCQECVYHPETFCLGCGGCDGGICGWDCTQPACFTCQVWNGCSGFAANLSGRGMVVPVDTDPGLVLVNDGTSVLQVGDCSEQLEVQRLALAQSDRVSLLRPAPINTPPEDPRSR